MIYDTLRKLPKIIQVEIASTGNVLLLDSEYDPKSEMDAEKAIELADVWDALCDDFHTRYNKTQKDKIFNLSKEIDYLDNKYECIQNACESLCFDYKQELIDMLNHYGYTLNESNYIDEINRIGRESEAILHKVKIFQKQLPQTVKNEQSQIDATLEAMGSYMAFLGIDFDFYSIPVEKFHIIEHQVEIKCKAIEKQQQKSKK